MTFRPTEGLKRAESVMQDIMNAAVACGMAPITNPEFRHGAKQIIANALDGFRSGVEAEPEFPLGSEAPAWSERFGPDEDFSGSRTKASNGSGSTFDAILDVNTGVTTIPTNPDAVVTKTAKRSRGRPKLSAAEKKKRAAALAKAKADAVEATAS